MSLPAWLMNLVKNTLDSYKNQLSAIGVLLPSDVPNWRQNVNAVFTGGMYDVSFQNLKQNSSHVPKRAIMDCVTGTGRKYGTRISTVLFIESGYVESIEIIAERHEWPPDEIEFELNTAPPA